jgi:hypothetical protein
MITYLASIQISLKVRILLILKMVPLTLTFTLKSKTDENYKKNSTTLRDDITFPIVKFPFISKNIPASQYLQRIEFTFHKL